MGGTLKNIVLSAVDVYANLTRSSLISFATERHLSELATEKDWKNALLNTMIRLLHKKPGCKIGGESVYALDPHSGDKHIENCAMGFRAKRKVRLSSLTAQIRGPKRACIEDAQRDASKMP